MLKKNLFLILLLLTAISQSYSEEFDFNTIFNSKLSQSEVEKLKSGQVLIRNARTSDNMVLNEYNENCNFLKLQVKNLNPSYLAEIIQIIPVNKNPNLIQNINNALVNIPSYKGIPYYSEHNKIWVTLYTKAEIKSQNISDNVNSISADFIMDPFGEISSAIKITKTFDSILYKNSNTTPITYNNITCVKPGKMQSYIVVFKFNDNWILYGIGGVNAPRVPFLTERIELSFMNRIKTFCNFIFSKLI